MFIKKAKSIQNTTARLPEFGYIADNAIYMDSACQSMRPEPVIAAINDYYKTYNACGERVKYRWGQKVDEKVESTRELVISYLGLSQKDYVCSFTLNTTFGLNLILTQISNDVYSQIITSEIEHNSVFLSTIELSKRLNIPRTVLPRDEQGNLIYDKNNLEKAIVVLNAASNIDGRLLLNIRELVKDAHAAGGIIIIDAAQAFAHYPEILNNCGADAICFSGHKTYASSLGIVVIRKTLLKSLDITFVGGGMVSGVRENDYSLLPEQDMASWLEPGLQAWGEIISLKSAIEWLKTVKPNNQKPTDYIADLSKQLFSELSQIDGLVLINNAPASVISFYSPKIDAHRLAVFLSASGIMARSGYFCCHYYLLEKCKYPPLLRLSIGLHTTTDDITKTIEAIKKFL